MRRELQVDEGHAALDTIFARYAHLQLANANEAETRLKVIDSIIRDVLGWRLEDMSVEEHCGEDGTVAFADYILRTASTAIVVEAKRAGAAFDLPSKRSLYKLGGVLSEGDVGDAIRQARDYARQRSIQFAVVTNGSAWIVFPAVRTDQVTFEESHARVFRDLASIKEHFVEFWELLSRQRVIEGNLEHQLLGFEREANRRRLTAAVSDAGYRLGRNTVFQLIEPAVAAAFMDETILDDTEALEACYVKTSERIKYDSRLQMYVADAKPALDHPSVRVRSKKSVQTLDNQISQGSSAAPRFIIVLGAVGVGKTTFLHYTRKVSAVEAISSKVIWLHVDFKKATVADLPRPFLYRELLRYIEDDTEFNLGDYEESIQPAYKTRIDNLRRGPLYLLARSDKAAFDKSVADTILADYNSVEPYVETVITHATRLRPGFLIVDNVDQIQDDLRQSEIFVEAQAAARRMQLNCVMCIREGTYQRNRTSPAFDAFQFDSLYIDAPQVTAVLSRRFAYAKRVLAGKQAEIVSEGGARFSVPDLSVLFEIVSRSVLEDETGFMMEMLAGGDVRRGLQLVREFLASGHTSADFALQSYLTSGEFQFPKHEVFRGAVLGQRKYYREEESLLLNVFDAKLDAGNLQLLRLHIVSWFVTKASSGVMEGVAADSLVDDLHRAGVSQTDVYTVLSALCDFRVLRTSDGLPFDPSSRLLPTRLAAYLLRNLAPTFAYFELSVIDSSIFDDATWNDLEALTRKIEAAPRYEKIAYRVHRARRYLQYVLSSEERWSVEARRHGLPTDWSGLVFHDQMKPELEADFERVIRSADRQYFKRFGRSLPFSAG